MLDCIDINFQVSDKLPVNGTVLCLETKYLQSCFRKLLVRYQ